MSHSPEQEHFSKSGPTGSSHEVPIDEQKFTLAEISELTGIKAEVLLTLATQPLARNARLSPRQQEVLEFIAAEIEDHQHSPTVREIGEAMGGISPSAVQEHLEALTRKGYISRPAPRATGINVLRPSKK